MGLTGCGIRQNAGADRIDGDCKRKRYSGWRWQKFSMLDSHKKRKEWEGSEGNAGSEPPFLGKGVWGRLSCNISSMRGSVSSPDETLRRELKIRRAAEYFWWTSRCFIEWWNALSKAWYCFSNKMILEGEIKDAKMSSFSSDFQTLMNYWWAWEGPLGDLKTKLHLSFRIL